MLTSLARLALPVVLIGTLAACSDSKEVARVGVDWTGNDIAIEAVADAKVPGVVCHVSFFQRSTIDRLQQGNWFEDPSNSSIACAASASTITVGNIAMDADGEEVFREGRSLIWKSLRVNRIYDPANNTLIYLAYARELQLGSAKMSLSVVPLNGLNVTWSNGQPPAAAAATLSTVTP